MTLPLLDQVLDAARSLPRETQDAVAADIIERIADYGTAELSAEQEQEVERRTSRAPNYADSRRTHTFLARFGIAA